jgi:hypothetical protein
MKTEKDKGDMGSFLIWMAFFIGSCLLLAWSLQ